MLLRDGPDLLGASSLDAVAQALESCDCDGHQQDAAVSLLRSTNAGFDKPDARSQSGPGLAQSSHNPLK